MTTVTARLYDGTGALQGELPDFISISPQDVLNDAGGWSMTYPISGINASRLVQDEDLEIGVLFDGQEVVRLLLEDDNWDQVQEETNEAVVTISGRDTGGLLDFAVVYPTGGVGAKPATQVFTNKSVGYILNQFITQSQARGSIPTVTYNFTGTQDSNGAAWVTTLTMTFQAGATLLSVLQGLSAAGYCDWRMVGHQLQIYNPNNFLASQKDVHLRRGTNIKSAPRQRSKRQLATSMLVLGDNDVSVERTNAAAIALRGRKEGFFSQGGTADTPTLQYFGDLQLQIRNAPRLSKTSDLIFPTDAGKMPLIDFSAGNYINTDVTGAEENYRVIQVSLVLTANGPVAGSVSLNDRFAEREVQVGQILQGVTTGGVTGSSTPVSPTPPTTAATDTVPPGGVSTIVATTALVTDTNGTTNTVTITWPAVTQNNDGTTLLDLDHYEIKYWFPDNPSMNPGTIIQTEGTRLDIAGLPQGVNFLAKVYAVDHAGNAGPYAQLPANLMLLTDTTAPPAPSIPTIDDTTYLSLIRATWDGKDNTGASMPGDFDHLEVYASQVNPPAQTTDNMVGSVRSSTGGSVAVPGDPGATYYIGFVAVDRNDNKSPMSAIVSGVSSMVDTGTITNTLVQSLQQNFYDAGGNASKWDPAAATSVTDASVADSETGGQVLRIVGPGQGMTRSDVKIPFDPGITYRVTFRVRQTVAATGGAAVQNVYFGLAGFAADGVTFVNVTGENSAGNQHYIAAAGVPLTAGAGWTTFTGYVKGTAAAGSNTVRSDPTNPGQMQSSTRYITPVMFVNYNGGDGTVEVDLVTVETVEVGRVDSLNISALAVTDAKINSVAVNKITAGTLVASWIQLGGRLTTAAGGVQSGARVEYDGGGIRAYNSAGTQTFNIDSAGSAWFKGDISGATGTFTGTVSGATVIGGTIKTAVGGGRVEMDAALQDRIQFFTNATNEAAPGLIQVSTYPGGGNANLFLFIEAPKIPGYSIPSIMLLSNSATATQSYVSISGGNGYVELDGTGIYLARCIITSSSATAIQSTPSGPTYSEWVQQNAYGDGLTISINSVAGQYFAGGGQGDGNIRMGVGHVLRVGALDGINNYTAFQSSSFGGYSNSGIGHPGGNCLVRWSPSFVDITNWVAGSWATIRALSFSVQSSSDYKADIEPLEKGWALDVIAKAPAYKWKYVNEELAEHVRKYEGQTVGGNEPHQPWHFGPVWEDIHDDVRDIEEAVDLRDLVGVLWAAVDEQRQEISELKKTLAGKVAA